MLNLVNPIKLLVLATFVHALLRLRWSEPKHRYLLAILLVCLITEILTSWLFVSGLPNGFVLSISISIHNALWLLLLRRTVAHSTMVWIGFAMFMGVASAKLLSVDLTSGFCYYIFVVGALIYTLVFLAESFAQLKAENMNYFLSNDYLLVFAPVLFFVSLSLLFGFDSADITSYRLAGNITLYGFVIYFVNIVYYTLINIYIYRETPHRSCITSQ